MPYSTLLIDLDDTVYPAGNGMWDAIAARIDRYMIEKLSLPPTEVPAIRKDLHRRFGTTLRGLDATRRIDRHDYLAFVHDIPLQRFLAPNPLIRAALQAVPMRRVIFTNADRAHALRVLQALELSDLFDQVIDILDIWPYCKPMPEAFRLALHKANTRPAECIFIDDAPGNLAGAQDVGLAGILVRPGLASYEGVSIPSLAELPSALARLRSESL